MSPLVILLIGMAVVVGGVLLLRLHAFLALVLGALVVAALTPRAAVRSYAIKDVAVAVVAYDIDKGEVELAGGRKQGLVAGAQYVMVREDGQWNCKPQNVILEIKEVDAKRSLARLGPDPRRYTFKSGDLALRMDQVAAAEDLSKKSIGSRIASGFGDTAASIGILIAMASIIGVCLLESGAAERIVAAAMSLFGVKRAPLAFLSSGFLLGIPVFFDTVFLLLIPLGKSMRARSGRDYLLYVLSIVAGGTMAHSLVPPTPGPLFVAEAMGVDVGVMMLAGLVVGLVTAGVGYGYAKWANAKWDLPLRDEAEVRAAASESDGGRRPPLWLALLPIALPVVLIAGKTIVDLAMKGVDAKTLSAAWNDVIRPTINAIGDKNVAITIAAAVSLVMLAWARRPSKEGLAKSVQRALASGGVIILITAAGGAFGAVMRQTDVASELAAVSPASKLMILPLAFLITTAVRTAQGSATVAMITAVGVVGSMLGAGSAGAHEVLGYHPVYVALAIGCGSKPISWMNDSGFWVMGKMSGMTEGETLRSVTVMMALMGVAGLAVVMIGAAVVPM